MPAHPAKIFLLVVLLALFGLTAFDTVSVAAGEKGDLYRHIERDGPLSFTNVPSDGRYKKVDLRAVQRTRLSMGRLEGTIVHHSRRHRLDPTLLSAVIKAESDFDPGAVSRAGAIGLMQLMPKTALNLDIFRSVRPPKRTSRAVGGISATSWTGSMEICRSRSPRITPAPRVCRNTILCRRSARLATMSKKVLRYYRMCGDRRFSEPQPFKPFASVTWPRTAPVAIAPNP